MIQITSYTVLYYRHSLAWLPNDFAYGPILINKNRTEKGVNKFGGQPQIFRYYSPLGRSVIFDYSGLFRLRRNRVRDKNCIGTFLRPKEEYIALLCAYDGTPNTILDIVAPICSCAMA